VGASTLGASTAGNGYLYLYHYLLTDKGMVQSNMSKPTLIVFTARIHTTKSTVKILSANTHWKYFLKNAENDQFSSLSDPWRNVHPLQRQCSTQHATLLAQAKIPMLRWRDNTAQGHAIAQAVSRQLHHGGPGSKPGLVMWNFVMDKNGAGAGFLRELRFPLPIYIHLLLHNHLHYHLRLAQ
jgi:hypothetical protein